MRSCGTPRRTSDAKTVVIGDSKKLRVVNVATGKARFSQLALPRDATCVALASDTRAVIGMEGMLVVADLAKQKIGAPLLLRDDDGDDRRIRTIAISRDGSHAVLLDGRLTVVDLATLSVVAQGTFASADYPINALACAPDGSIAVTTGRGDLLIYR